MGSREVTCIDMVYGVEEVADSERCPQEGKKQNSNNAACGAKGHNTKIPKLMFFFSPTCFKRSKQREATGNI